MGPVWFTLQLASGAPVLRLAPDMGKLIALASLGITGINVFGLYPGSAPADLEVRSFAPADGVPEDPVCGSGNGCVAALIRREAILPAATHTANQGRCLGRDRRIDVHKRESHICILAEGGEVIERRIRAEPERFAAVLGARPRTRILIEASTDNEWVARCLGQAVDEAIQQGLSLAVDPVQVLGVAPHDVLHPERRIARPDGVIVTGERGPEERHDPIAHDLVDGAS